MRGIATDDGAVEVLLELLRERIFDVFVPAGQGQTHIIDRLCVPTLPRFEDAMSRPFASHKIKMA